ncbi:MAG: hypothetical protein JSU59_08345 [Nitrospirota bacterium]|nr:MAG: hypothetical protein JSU59_08345 [Nitrospirota bacterium]
MVRDTLGRLYELDPEAKAGVEKAAGYAVFSNFGLKIMFAGSGSGAGLAVNNKTGKETYMKMFEMQAGLGMGAKTFSQIFVFSTEGGFNDFVEKGWTFGGQATAAAKHEDTGEAYQQAVAVAPGVYLYQLTDTGRSAEMTAKGTKYYKDDDLN